MILPSRFPLTLAVWAIVIGAGAILAFFLVGFRDSIHQEREAFHRLARQDSLLEATYRITWDAHLLARRSHSSLEKPGTSSQQYAAHMRQVDRLLQDLRMSIAGQKRLEPLIATLEQTIDSIRSELTGYFDPTATELERRKRGRELFEADISSSMARLRRLKENLDVSVMEVNIMEIAHLNDDIESKYSFGAFIGFGFVILGVGLTLFLRRVERRQKDHARRLVSGEEQFRSIVENVQDGILVLQDHRPVFANPAALALLGFSGLSEMQVTDLSELLSTEACTVLFERSQGLSNGEEIAHHEEFRCRTLRGLVLDVELNARMVRWNEGPAVLVSIRDITRRKMQEREQALLLWEQEALSHIDRRLIGVIDLHRILDEILAQVISLSQAPWAGILMREGQTERLLWRAMKGGYGSMPAHPITMVPTLRALLTGTEPLVVQEVAGDRDARLSSVAGLGDERLVSTVWIPLKGEQEARGVLAVGYRQAHEFAGRELRLLMPMAEKTSIAASNASLYEDLLSRERELEVLSGARVNAQEEERRRIAREIHDGLGQILTAVKFNIEILEDSSSLGQDDRRRISDMKTLLDNVMKEAREISYNLMPSVLDDFGLAPALQLLSERFGVQTGIQVTFAAQGMAQRLPGSLEIALYRIVQEALNNAVRHGEATLVAIQAFRTKNAIRLTIEDNGKGMRQDDAVIRRMVGSGIGIASMRERVNSFRGEFLLESAPGHGTLVSVEIPVKEEEGQHV